MTSSTASSPSDLAQLRHDLRTPINQIVGYSELLMEEAADHAGGAARIDDLQKIRHAAQELLGLINENLADGQVTLAAAGAPRRSRAQLAVTPPITETPWVAKPPTPAVHPGRILVADDQAQNRALLSQQLARRGHSVVVAENGADALRQLRAGHFDLVLLDMIMPELDGYHTLIEIKGDPQLRDLPVIMVSALDEADRVVRCIERGAEDYLAKPINQVLLDARIGAGLEKKRLRDQETKYQREIEAAHRQLQQELEQKRVLVEQLSQANEAKNRFLGMASHDLRNPLASIRGLSDMMQRGVAGPLTADQRPIIQSIREAAAAMFELVNELLDVATIESGKLNVVLSPHDITALVQKSVALTNLEAAKKGTRVDYAASNAAIRFPLDAAKIRQVVDNLLSNAVKYSPPGVTVLATLVVDAVQGLCYFAVRDRGPGIPDDERHKLFRDFSRLSAQPTGGEKSTGLGLAICRKIVEAHQGTIDVENLPAGGCEFRVALPLHP